MSDDEGSEMSQPSIARKPILERHFHSLLLSLITALVIGTCATTIKLVETTARQDERIAQLVEATRNLSEGLIGADSRFLTAETAEIYRQQYTSRIDGLELRIERMEGSR